MSLRNRIIGCALVGVLVAVVPVGVVWWHADRVLREKQQTLLNDQAVAIGDAVTRQVLASAVAYAEQSESNQASKGSLIAPGTFLKKMTEASKEHFGNETMSVEFQSEWNINPRNGLESDFVRDGWKKFLAQSQSKTNIDSVWQRGSNDQGLPVLRVVSPVRALTQNCVDCHNMMEQTAEIRALRGGLPPKQFAVGDLMGTVITTVPIAKSEAIVGELTATQKLVGRWIWTAMFLGVSSACVVGIIFGQRVTSNVQSIASHLDAIAQGDFNSRLPAHRKDELGRLSSGFNRFADRLLEVVKRATQQTASVAEVADRMSSNMGRVASSTESVSSNMQDVSVAIGQMAISIQEVAGSAERSAKVARKASDLVVAGNDQVGQLGKATQEIGKVVSLIQEIAGQTHLLALNATIEAARAGEQGKGFAVVAHEVKLLAQQTGSATDEIRQQVEYIQNTTEQVVASIGQMLDVVHEVNSAAEVIAAAVEEQGVVSKQIAERISMTASTAGSATTEAHQTVRATQEIIRSVATLDDVLQLNCGDQNLAV